MAAANKSAVAWKRPAELQSVKLVLVDAQLKHS